MNVEFTKWLLANTFLRLQSSPTRCLGALEFINWDVHKSIKLIKLQNLVGDENLSLSAAFEALQQQEWDLHTTAVKLKGIKL